MNAAALAILLCAGRVVDPGVPIVRVAAQTAMEQPAGDLKSAVQAKLRELEANGSGIFSQDVSGIVVPFFPPGQSFESVEASARDHGLRPLHVFKGNQEPGIDATYVAEMNMRETDFETLDLAVYFGFVRRDGRLVLRTTTAMLRADYM